MLSDGDDTLTADEAAIYPTRPEHTLGLVREVLSLRRHLTAVQADSTRHLEDARLARRERDEARALLDAAGREFVSLRADYEGLRSALNACATVRNDTIELCAEQLDCDAEDLRETLDDLARKKVERGEARIVGGGGT